MVMQGYDPKTVKEGYHHSWSMNPAPASLEAKTDYRVKPQATGNQDYSEGSKSNYSDGQPDIPGYFLG